jgi:hypothetical protein
MAPAAPWQVVASTPPQWSRASQVASTSWSQAASTRCCFAHEEDDSATTNAAPRRHEADGARASERARPMDMPDVSPSAPGKPPLAARAAMATTSAMRLVSLALLPLASAVSLDDGGAAEAGLRLRCPEVFSLSGTVAAHRLHPSSCFMKPEPHLVVGDSFADGVGASAAGDLDLAPNRTGVQCASPCGWAGRSAGSGPQSGPIFPIRAEVVVFILRKATPGPHTSWSVFTLWSFGTMPTR